EVDQVQFMKLDPATLADLEIVSTPIAGGPTLLGLLDRTRIRGGRDHLRRRLTAPPHEAAEIIALQQAHRTFAADAASYRTILDRVDLDQIERYLASNWQLPNARHGLERLAGSLWRPVWHQQYLTEIGVARSRIIALLDAVQELSRRLT